MTKEEFRSWHSRKTWRSFFYSLIGVTLPFFLSLIVLVTISKYEFIVPFLDDGQVLLFSVGLLTSAFYIFREDENQDQINNLRITLFKKEIKLDLLGDFVTLFLMFSSVSYAILYVFLIITPSIEINLWFIRLASIGVFAFSMFAVFQSIRVDYLSKFPKVDVRKESQEGVENILDQLP